MRIVDSQLASTNKPNDQPRAEARIEALPKLQESCWRSAFGLYRKAVAKSTEAADEYHFFTLLTRAGLELGRKVFFYLGLTLYPNFYCVLYGPTGDKKTTAMTYFDQLGTSDLRTIRGAGSAEGLCDQLQKLRRAEPCLIWVPEYSEVLKRARWNGSTLLPFLTGCYDSPAFYEVLYRHSGIRLEQPTISMLGGTTGPWFWASTELSDFQGGYGNRVCYVTGTSKDPIEIPERVDLSAVREAVDRLAEIETLDGGTEMRLNLEARKRWKEYYHGWVRNQKERDEMLRYAVERTPAHVLKVAMVYSAFEGTLFEINLEQLEAAILVGDYLVASASELLANQYAGSNRRKELERRIVAFVLKEGGRDVKKRYIYKSLWRHYSNAKEFEDSFRALVNCGELGLEPGIREGSFLVSIMD